MRSAERRDAHGVVVSPELARRALVPLEVGRVERVRSAGLEELEEGAPRVAARVAVREEPHRVLARALTPRRFERLAAMLDGRPVLAPRRGVERHAEVEAREDVALLGVAGPQAARVLQGEDAAEERGKREVRDERGGRERERARDSTRVGSAARRVRG